MRSNRRSRPENRDEQVLPVEAGRVVCPRRGVIDLELCFVCPHFSGFQEGVTEDLVCGYESIPGIMTPIGEWTSPPGSVETDW
jgi:hypothetical protein